MKISSTFEPRKSSASSDGRHCSIFCWVGRSLSFRISVCYPRHGPISMAVSGCRWIAITYQVDRAALFRAHCRGEKRGFQELFGSFTETKSCSRRFVLRCNGFVRFHIRRVWLVLTGTHSGDPGIRTPEFVFIISILTSVFGSSFRLHKSVSVAWNPQVRPRNLMCP